jgi:hypothetical protein
MTMNMVLIVRRDRRLATPPVPTTATIEERRGTVALGTPA